MDDFFSTNLHKQRVRWSAIRRNSASDGRHSPGSPYAFAPPLALGVTSSRRKGPR
jgi:hypothetical protein